MKLYNTTALPAHWIVEDARGDKWIVPAIFNGWKIKRAYRGNFKLDVVCDAIARRALKTVGAVDAPTPEILAARRAQAVADKQRGYDDARRGINNSGELAAESHRYYNYLDGYRLGMSADHCAHVAAFYLHHRTLYYNDGHKNVADLINIKYEAAYQAACGK